jgi:hypothetical protein
MCYEYDWMQKVSESEDARRIKEKADQLTKQDERAPAPPTAPPRTKEPLPA